MYRSLSQVDGICYTEKLTYVMLECIGQLKEKPDKEPGDAVLEATIWTDIRIAIEEQNNSLNGLLRRTSNLK